MRRSDLLLSPLELSITDLKRYFGAISVSEEPDGFIERFNRSYRQAVLDMYVFRSLHEVREQTEKWLNEYNEERPHDALGDLSPKEFLLIQKPEISTHWWS